MTNDRFRGMNVNERLLEAKLFAQWDDAVHAGDAATMNDILVSVEITDEGAKEIVASVLADPKRYGYRGGV